MKIAITADPKIPVPPMLYGGIERIIDLLIVGLRQEGHDVTLFAHQDSKVACTLLPYQSSGSGQIATLANIYTINKVLLTQKFDFIHSFGRLAYLLPQMPRNIPKLMSYQREPTVSQVKRAVKISAMHTLAFTGCSDYITNKIRPYAEAQTIYNCIDIHRFTATATIDNDAPLVFLGRVEEIKGAHTAIEIAVRSNKRLIIAGNIPDGEMAYFNEKILPALNERITYAGSVDDIKKNEILRHALALLMPIHWDEPFGIVMIEAMACGTPVIGFNRGAVPEIVANGVSGFYGTTIEELTAHVENAQLLNRQEIRRITEKRFAASVIVQQYLTLYNQMIDR